MFDVVSPTKWFNASSSNDEQGTTQPVAMTDANGRTVGIEDPNDVRMQDETSPSTANGKDLLPSRGLPYIDPRRYGGSMLDKSAGLGEPLNVIISALSSPEVLTRKGLQNYLRSLDFDIECLGLHSGQPQTAFLDPRGWVDENFLYRQVYTPFDHVFGTCIESLAGGNHLRAWQQQGTGAWFFATSREENVTKHHMIVPNGYDVGRDALVSQTQPDNKSKTTSFMFKTYKTKVEYVTNLLAQGDDGINHQISIDGRVALLTVKLLSSDDKALLKAKRKAVTDQQATSQSTSTSTPSSAQSNTGLQQKRRSLLTRLKPQTAGQRVAAA